MSSLRGCVVAPHFVWLNGAFEEGQQLRIDNHGVITQIGENLAHEGETIVELPHEAFVPGFVNAHSHAFHRQLRGRSEIGGGQTSANDFWKWRDNMYTLVENATYDKIYEYCVETFEEMLRAGITTVGEFHYVHHGKGRFDLDEAVLRAADKTGIRLVLIQTFYERAGFDSPPLHSTQRRFVSDLHEFQAHLAVLEKKKGPRTTVAVAVTVEHLQSLWEWAEEAGKAFHVHLEEQPKELVDCISSEGRVPSDLLLDSLAMSPLFTVVHATHTSRGNMDRFQELGVNVCVCPCTEGYLGDGIPSLSSSVFLSFGSDCNNRISFMEEMRWAAFTQQMKNVKRSVAGLSAARLLESATKGGARSLALSTVVGEFAVGRRFDFVSFNVSSPVLKGVTRATLADALVFAAGNAEIKKSGVDGEILYSC